MEFSDQSDTEQLVGYEWSGCCTDIRAAYTVQLAAKPTLDKH